MTKNKRTVLLTIITFLIIIVLVTIMNSDITFAVEEGVYYADDLKTGDILPTGSKIIANIDYHDASGRYADYVYLRFIPAKNDTEHYYESRNYTNVASDNLSCCYSNKVYYYEPSITTDEGCKEKYGTNSYHLYAYDTNSFRICVEKPWYTLENYSCDLVKVASNEPYTLLDYESYIGETNMDFSSWKVVNVSANIIYLEPSDDVSIINKTPSSTNDWTIDTTAVNKSGTINKWYKYKTIDNHEFYQSNANVDNIWKYTNGIYSISDNNTGNINDTYSVIYTFDAQKDDIIYFEMKSYGYYGILYSNDVYNPTEAHHYQITTNIYQNDEIISGISSTDFYKANYLKIEDSGTHTLKISYKVPSSYSNKVGYQNYIYIKNLMVLTPLNYEKTLNEELVSEGDNLFYESIDSNGIVLSEKVVYEKKAEDNIDDTTNDNEQNSNGDDKNTSFDNPETFSNIIIIILLMSIVIFSTFITYKQNKKKIK